MEWTTIDELLDLFSVRASYSGTEWFCRLVEFNAMYAAFPDLGVGYGDIIRAELRRLRCSPLLYWGQQRRALRPLLESDALTLRALGLDVSDDLQGLFLRCWRSRESITGLTLRSLRLYFCAANMNNSRFI